MAFIDKNHPLELQSRGKRLRSFLHVKVLGNSRTLEFKVLVALDHS